MKKILLFITLLCCVAFSNAQNDKNSLALQLVIKNTAAIGLSQDQLNNLKLSSTYYNEIAGTQMVYLLQTYKGLPVHNQMLVLAFKNEKVVSNAGAFLPAMDSMTQQRSALPSLNAISAIRAAFLEAKISVPGSLSIPSSSENGNKLDFGKTNAVTENITAELIWVPVENGHEKWIKLAWQVQVVPKGKSDWWNIQVDASNGAIIGKVNLTVYEGKNNHDDDFLALFGRKEYTGTKEAHLNNKNFFNPPPPTITTGDYRVIPFPIESPNFGAAAVVNNPWLLSGAGNNATTNGWHFDGTTNYNITRGNNVFAYLDVSNLNAPNSTNNWPDTSTSAIPSLSFTQTPIFTQQPSAVVNKKFAVTNLFYWNNLMHDVFYQYGFNEVSGNFQTDNIGRGGNGNDYVQAEAQDGLSTNNANFSTPTDGSRPRMQMFLWDAAPTSTNVVVNAPGTIAGTYAAVESNFSTANQLSVIGPVTAQVVYYNDAAGGTHEACTGAPTSSITGKIALINRGTCNFTVKALAAQAAGAVGIIMVNNVAGAPIIMGGGPDNTITIPAVMVTDVTGALIAAQLATGVNATLNGGVKLDGDIDNGIVAHEYGHGISNRLTGGPANSSCLQNAEQGGEGWSDYMALMMTTNWGTATAADGALARPVGTYAWGETATGAGIRNYPYSTNLAVNPLTYANMGVAPIGTEIHNTGEVWCAALWEMTWGLIQQNGINNNLFNATGVGGNSIALKLVVEGMRTQPCSPGFIDARNAILTADQNLYGGAHICTIWAAFAKRGMGYSALQGSSFSAIDQTPAFDLPPAPAFSTQPINTAVCAGTNATFTATASAYNLTYNWQVSTNGGTSWSNVSPAVTTATLTLTAVTGAINNNLYRCVINGGCPNSSVNSNAVLLTVNTSAPVISSQPANTSACVGTNATFNITATGTNTYNWQVSTDGGTTWNNVSPVVTTTTLTLTAVTSGMNNNQYRCVVTGGCPSANFNSSPATLTITTGGISVTGQPANTSACAGNNATFTVTATGTSLTYNWQESTDGGVTWSTTSPAATTATLTLSAVTTGMNNNQYRCVVNGPGACTPAGLTSGSATLTVNSAIAISSQPVNASVCTGNNATFSVTATGTNPTYNWQVSTDGGSTWNNTSPAVTTATLTLTAVTAGMNNYQYRCVVAGTCTAVGINSNAATLTINTPASVTSQPANTATCIGSNASFSVTASGSGLSYNWQVSTDGGTTWNNTAPVVTTATLTLTAVTIGMNNNQYRCVVSIVCNPVGVNSTPATLTVNAAPAITSQPANTAVCAGTNASFCVTATGFNPTYQWQVSTTGCTGTWTNVTGATASCLSLTAVTAAMNNNNYRCVVSGTCTPAVTSSCVTLTVNTAAAITAQPVNTTGCTAGSATFSTTATGTGLSYNWQVSTDAGATWNNVSPAVTTATLTLTGLTTGMNNYQYRVAVTGTCTPAGINSSAATLSINSVVTIATQPANTALCAGANASFTAAASGTGLTQQWQVSTDGGTTWTNIAGATSATLTLNAVTTSMNNNKYRVVYNGTCTTNLNSTAATLTVNTSANILTQPVNTAVCRGSNTTISVTATGSTITYQWQVSINGSVFANLVDAAPYAGVTTATLSISNANMAMNGYVYRVIVSGIPCGAVISSPVTLRVNELPGLVLAASEYNRILPSLPTTLYTTISPVGNYTYKWFKNAFQLTGVLSDKLPIDIDGFGQYIVIATDVNGCSVQSNTVSINDSVSNQLFVYPNPSAGQFQVRYYSSNNTLLERTLTVYDGKGAKVYSKQYSINRTYDRMDVNLINMQSGIYTVDLRDNKGNRIATGSVIIQ